jgi:hypothetical protein
MTRSIDTRLAKLEAASAGRHGVRVFVADNLEGEAFDRWRQEMAATVDPAARAVFVQIVDAAA